MLPLIPQDTARAARTLYGRGNLYLKLGDRLNTLISKLNPQLLTIKLHGNAGTFLAVLTIIQYVEELSDLELAGSLQQRVDLRYALHLPTPGPGFDPYLPCTFRFKVLTEQRYQSLFEEIFKKLYPEIASNHGSKSPDTMHVVKAICANTIRAFIVKSMFRCIEALSANYFHWLRQIALPHWYTRYGHSWMMVGSGASTQQKELTLEEVAGDIEHLLNEASQSSSLEINELSEIKILRSVWGHLSNCQLKVQCNYCPNNRMERRPIFNPNDQI